MKKIRLIIISLLAGMCTPALSTPVNVTDTIQRALLNKSDFG